jgi:hypothetical protein
MGFEILNVSRPSRVGEGRVGDRPLDFSVSRYFRFKNPFLADVIGLFVGSKLLREP